ncbi:DNA distortion polypeptide 1 [Morganella morganii]|uniref:DNA distortion polypeptide 1 n=1 Tax=Morganella morganii TaxID=582 RepID=UPI00345BEF76
MKQINFRIPDEEYDFFEKKVRECFNISLPMFFKKVGLHTLSHDSEIRKIKADLKNDLGSESFYKDRYIPFKANDELYHGLKENAEKHGWSLSKEIRFRLKHTMNNDLDFFDQELKVMRDYNNQLKRVGRNINMILRRDDGKILEKEEFKQDIVNLQKNINEMQRELEGYIKKCKGRSLSQHVSVVDYGR